MATAIAGFTPTTPTAAAGGSTSLNTMTGGDFLNLMIQQLQQQDPLNPTDSNQLLTQMSQISTLQSNNAMVNSLSGLTLQQSIGAGSNLIGKTVTGIDDTGATQANKIVTSIKVVNKKIRLQLDNGIDMAMENVTQINGTSATAAAGNPAVSNASALASVLPQLQSLLNSGSSGTGATNSTGTGTTTSNLSNLAAVLSALGLK